MVPKLRIILYLALVPAVITLSYCDGETVTLNNSTVEMSAGGKVFSVPTQHLAFLQPSARISPLSGATGGKELLVYFSAAWLSAHIDGYQPVLNNGFEGETIYIVVGEQAKKDRERLHPVSVDLWYKRGTYENRVVLSEKEPNTGFFIIQPIAYKSLPDYDREQWFLSETVPDESQPYPDSPQWRPYICHRTNGIIEGAKVATKCGISKKIAEDIFIQVHFHSENLQVRETVFSVIAEEINSWIIDKDSNNGG